MRSAPLTLQHQQGTLWNLAPPTQGLVSLAADVEKAIGRELPFISGGASTSFYMLQNGSMPMRVNNLRIGELILTGQING